MTKFGDDKIPGFLIGIWLVSLAASLAVTAVIVWAIVKVVSALT